MLPLKMTKPPLQLDDMTAFNLYFTKWFDSTDGCNAPLSCTDSTKSTIPFTPLDDEDIFNSIDEMEIFVDKLLAKQKTGII